MANKQPVKQAGKGHGKQNGAGGSIKGPACAANSTNDRKAARKEEARAEEIRLAEIANGTYYPRLNANRSSDIVAACRGEVGNYAFPGGNAPSLHFNVQKEVGKQGSLSVIRLETVQRGHELEGEVFDQKVFLPSFYVEKFGGEFRSRFDDRLASSTQELICHYLADQLGFGGTFGATDEVTNVVNSIETSYEQAGTDEIAMKEMLSGIPGLYGCKTERGTVIIEVFVTNRPNIKVVDSTLDDVQPGRYFLPVHLISRNRLDQVTDDETYARQLALYMFLRNELADLLSKPADPKEERTPGKKELQKGERRKALNLAAANERATEATTIANMKAKAISLREAATGKQGWVVMTHTSGDLIVLYGMVGLDKIIQVAHLDRNHILRLAGVDVGTKVYVGQVRVGEIDRIDQVNHRLTGEQVKACNALITHLRDQLEANGIKLIAPSRNLRLVKSA